MLGLFKSFSSNIHYKYSVQSHPTFQSGCWSVFDAKNKTTNDPVSVFVIEKKTVQDLLASNGIKPRSAVVAEVWEFAMKGVQQLTKIRHPAVLKLVEPLETHKNSLCFVTERVISTIESMRETDQHELTIVRGLSNIVQALQFLHNQLGMVHNNMRPSSVFIDAQGDWKLMGFEFLVKFEEFSSGDYFLPQLDPRMPTYMQPTYDFLAPELVMKKMCVPASDTWSLACLIYAVYTQKPPLNTRYNPSEYKEELRAFQRRLGTNKLPKSLKPYLNSLFCEDPNGRISLEALETTDFFQNPLVKSLKALDEYAAKPAEEKVSFLKHFSTLLPQFPKQIRIRKIMKFAVGELSGPRDPATGKYVGDVLFAVCQDMSKLTFQEQILPLFGKLSDYTAFQESVVGNLEVVVKATSDKDFSKHVVPLFVEILKQSDAQHATMQTLLLNQTQLFSGNLTVSKVEELLFPAVVDCFAATNSKQVKIAATVSLSVLVHTNVSKTHIIDRLIPALQGMKTRDPDIVVAVAKLWVSLSTKLNNEQIFTEVLPTLLQISLAKQLTVTQFKELIGMIRTQIDNVESTQVKDLAHNTVVVDEFAEIPQQKSYSSSPAPVPAPVSAPAPAPAPAINAANSMNSFSSLNSIPTTNQASPAFTGSNPAVKQSSHQSFAPPPSFPKPQQPSVPQPSFPALSVKPAPSPLSLQTLQTLKPMNPSTPMSSMNTMAPMNTMNTMAPMAPMAPMASTQQNSFTQPLQPNNTFTPLVPFKPAASDDDFGEFSSSPAVTQTSNFDSLI